ncbi:EamA family transporter [Saccharibacter sp. 17.LH.SD]|uniref:EamA family transporter n=1 Tax=Saccharibacter sp. 17.LH.SD TaxID=2689393 RepID=UPI00136FA462|nr:EamA family transporter [Saccharibacter sp. 17.LH.SD]MXV43564.1 EamA family transporter [Saccharibacter sp. 17.LH.SD]
MKNLPPKHILAALLVVLIWGVNFVVIKIGLHGISPLLLCFLRFFLAGFPAILFVKRPAVPFLGLAAYGLFNFVGQFIFLFTGMYLGVSAGLASVILQVQVFITLGLAVFFLHEKPTFSRLIGALVSLSGIGFLALHVGGDITLRGLFFVLLAAFSWACGNIVTKRFHNVDVFGLVVWGSAIASVPLFILCFFVDGWASITNTVVHLDRYSLFALAYLVYPTTLLGYALWNNLLKHYNAAQVVPFTLLVPIFGLASSVIFLHEPIEGWKIIASSLVFLGLLINLFAPRLIAAWRNKKRPDYRIKPDCSIKR